MTYRFINLKAFCGTIIYFCLETSFPSRIYHKMENEIDLWIEVISKLGLAIQIRPIFGQILDPESKSSI